MKDEEKKTGRVDKTAPAPAPAPAAAAAASPQVAELVKKGEFPEELLRGLSDDEAARLHGKLYPSSGTESALAKPAKAGKNKKKKCSSGNYGELLQRQRDVV